MSGNELAPIIIKKVKKGGGDGHHGGAWKVAYADFVTAMMAFFLLMWLLNATTEVQRKGLADYFNPTIPINRISGGGDGSFQGDSMFTEDTQLKNGIGATNRRATEERLARGDTGVMDPEGEKAGSVTEEEEVLREVEEMLLGRAGESMVSDDVARHIVTRVTDEGLIVELFDLPERALFEPGTAQPVPLMRELVAMVADIFKLVRNEVAVSGYTSAMPVVVADNPVWDLSSGRADTVRRLLEQSGLDPKRLQRVSGYADRKPAARNPMAPRNNRVEIILLRKQE